MFFVLIQLSLQTSYSTSLSSSYVLRCFFLTHIAKGQRPCPEAVFVFKDSPKTVRIFSVFSLLFDQHLSPIRVSCFFWGGGYFVTADKFNTCFLCTILLLFLTSSLALVQSLPITIRVIALLIQYMVCQAIPFSFHVLVVAPTSLCCCNSLLMTVLLFGSHCLHVFSD